MPAISTEATQLASNWPGRRDHELVIQTNGPVVNQELVDDTDVEIPPFLLPGKVKTHPHHSPTHTTDSSGANASGLPNTAEDSLRANTTSTIIICSVVAGSILALGALFWAFKIWRLHRAARAQDDEDHGWQRKGDVVLQEKFKKGWKKATRRRRNSTWFDCPAILNPSQSMGGEAYSVIGSGSYASTKFLIHDPEKDVGSVAPTLYYGSPERNRPVSDLSTIPSFDRGFGPPLEVGSLHKPPVRSFMPRPVSPTSLYSQPSIPAGLARPITPCILDPRSRETQLADAPPRESTTLKTPHDMEVTKIPYAHIALNKFDDDRIETQEPQECLISTTSPTPTTSPSSHTSPRFSATSVTESIMEDAIYHQNSPQKKPKTPPRLSKDGSQLSSSFEYDRKFHATSPKSAKPNDGSIDAITSSRSLVSFTAPSSPERVLLPAPEHTPRSRRKHQATTPPARKPVKSILKTETRDRKNRDEPLRPSRSKSHLHGPDNETGRVYLQGLPLQPNESLKRVNTGQADADRSRHGVALPCEPLRTLQSDDSIAPRVQSHHTSTSISKSNDMSKRMVSSRASARKPVSTSLHLPTVKTAAGSSLVESPSSKDLGPLLTAMGIAGQAAALNKI